MKNYIKTHFLSCLNNLLKQKYGVATVCYFHVTYEVQSESTLHSLPECQGTPCVKQAPYLKFK